MGRPVRLLVYDRTCRGRGVLPGLSLVWGVGAWLYRVLGRIDRHLAAGSWQEALGWLADRDGEIAEVQFWGHGRFGELLLAGEPLDAGALSPGHRHHQALVRLRARLSSSPLFWFRTCETFGTARGKAFARAWTRFFRCRAAGHTFVIWFWQSGLHVLGPGEEPWWSSQEGLRPGAREGRSAVWSSPFAPSTVTCLTGRIPPRIARGERAA